MFSDKTTEAIAHFIGLFDVASEGARLRKSFDEFVAQRHHNPEQTELETHPVSPKAPFELSDFHPGVPYHPSAEPLVDVVHDTRVTYRPLPTKELGLPPSIDYPSRGVDLDAVSRSGHGQLDPQGSVGVFVNQEIRLQDNDYVSVGSHGLTLRKAFDPAPSLHDLIDAAEVLDPLDTVSTRGATNDTASLIAFVEAAAEAFRSYSAPTHTKDDVTQKIYLERGSSLAGSFVNGSSVTDLPTLEDYLRIKPESEEEAEAPTDSIRMGGDTPSIVNSATGSTVAGVGDYADHAFVDVKAGSNSLVNTAIIENQWAAGHVIATVGDYHQLDAITQINIVSDNDAVSASLNGWRLKPAEATEAFNVAMFQNTDLTQHHLENLPAPGQFPTQWAITTLTGDLTILSWIEQLSFVSDNDMAILSSTGVKITVGTGENMALNDTFITDLGKFYDLIIVGGGIYDANIISQTNILLDDDLIGTLPGFKTYGEANLSSSHNLLWNSATIQNLQGAGTIEALPDAYKKAAANLASGNENLPKGVFNDAMFEGLAGLRVLYVTGNFMNLQYVKQTNVLGDHDQIALAMSKVADTAANWTVSTGSNQLINLAGIMDVDLSGKVYVGGQAYSDATLVQAELISNKPSFDGFAGFNASELTKEAVAFLQDDLWNDTDYGHSTFKPVHAGDSGAFDALHAMLG